MALQLWRRIAIAVILVGGFAVYWASLAFEWDTPLWALPFGVVIALAAVSLLSTRRRAPSRRGEDLYASDAYSDISLGRGRPRHPHHDTKPNAQFGPALPMDPIAEAIQRRRESNER